MNIITRDFIKDSYVLEVLSKNNPDKVIGTYTKADIVDMIDRWHTFFETLGIGYGDSIAFNDYISVEHLSCLIACGELGIRYLSLPRVNILKLPDELIKEHNISVVFENTGLDRVRNTKNVKIADVKVLKNIKPKKDAKPDPRVNENTPYILCNTSGSTGKPKNVIHSHKSTLAPVQAVTHQYKQDDVITMITSLNHFGILVVQVLTPMLVGIKAISTGDFSSTSLLEAILKYRPTVSFIFRSHIDAFSKHPDWLNADLSFIRAAFTAGESIHDDVIDTFIFQKKVQKITVFYGQTEALPISYCCINYEDAANNKEHIRSLGKLTGLYDCVIAEDGELLVKSDAMHLTAVLLDDSSKYPGYLATGDIVEKRGDHIYFVKRKYKKIRHNDVLIEPDILRSLVDQFKIDGKKVLEYCQPTLISDKKEREELFLNIVLEDNVDITGEDLLEKINKFLLKEYSIIYCVDGIAISRLDKHPDQIKPQFNKDAATYFCVE